jgi:hypothetical protein
MLLSNPSGGTPVSMLSSSSSSIRAIQLEAFEKLLKSVSEQSSPWKIIIYDKFSRDVVTTLASAKRSLWRDHNVTLKMLIDSPRERVADVSAVYFVLPTQENLAIIARDASNALYDSLHLHFTSPTSKESLEWLAKEVARLGGAVSIAKVWDQFLGFVSLERSLFSLNLPNSFAAYNAANAKDDEVIGSLNKFAVGLTNVLATLGRVPIIRCERNGPAKELAELVNQKVNQLLKDRSTFQAEQTTIEPRPMLLILDRGSDMCTPLLHSDGYQCLVDDLLGPLRLNRIEFVAKDGEDGTSKKHVCDLDPENDLFWGEVANHAFPDAIREQTEAVKEVDEKARRLGANTTASQMPSEEDGGGTSSALMEAVQALPELTERKRFLVLHGTIMRAVFQEIQKRSIPKFNEVENRMLLGRQASKAEKKHVTEFLQDPSKSSQDKLRLLIIHAYSAKLSVQELDELEKTLFATSEPGKASDECKQTLSYIRRMLSVAASFHSSTSASASKGPSATAGLFSTFDSAFMQFQEKLQTVANSVTGSASWGPAARAVEAVCSGAGGIGSNLSTDVSAEIDSQYLYFDPKVGTNPVPPTANSRFRGQFQKCILFIVGGGCYNEYHNLCQYSNQRKREILYGATEILSPSEFLRQMRESA